MPSRRSVTGAMNGNAIHCFTFEGIFRQHMITKGRSRDTAYFSMLDSEWPVRKHNFERWLSPENFNPGGRQKTSLAAMNNQQA
jgi:hypothetical protein